MEFADGAVDADGTAPLEAARGGAGGLFAELVSEDALGELFVFEVEVFLGAWGRSAMAASYQSFSEARDLCRLRQVAICQDDYL